MNAMILSLYIGIGGFFGAIARYLLSRAVGGWLGAFPLGTLLVNVSGSFVLGLILYGVAYGKGMSPELRGFWTVGFIGAFTTMSAFAYETVRLLEMEDYSLLSLNCAANVLLSIFAVLAGRYVALTILR
ncbi:MAG TPA: fluoride efflux transporter CrcB [Candidatus Binatia bacterium]